MTIHSEADIVGAQTVPISSTPGAQARRIWLTAIGGPARFGDANVGSAEGVDLPQNVEYVFSASDADPTDTIDLNAAYVYVPSGTTLTVAWGI